MSFLLLLRDSSGGGLAILRVVGGTGRPREEVLLVVEGRVRCGDFGFRRGDLEKKQSWKVRQVSCHEPRR